MRIHTFLLVTTAFVLISCGGKDKPVPDPAAVQQMNLPPANEATAADVDVSGLDSLPGFTKLPAVEQEIFGRTIQLQVKHYANLENWANEANTVRNGRDASISLRLYIAYLEDFEKRMKALDQEFTGKLPPNYSESKQFNKVVEAYMTDADLQRRTEYIMNTLISLMQRYQNDPACKDVFADLQKMATEAR